MKSLVRSMIPQFLLGHYREFRRNKEQKRNRNRTPEEVFAEVYEKNKWGGTKGTFYSGDGSADEKIVSDYISMVSEKANSSGFSDLTFVDLGCGDFRIGRQLLPLCSKYVGVDVVEPLIRRNQERFGDESTVFMHLDIVNDDLPKGDICFVRQVLQHLSNHQIATILNKLNMYKRVFITEHYPTESDVIRPNIDIVHGMDNRVARQSGVYLSEPPFNIPSRQLSEVLAVSGAGQGEGNDQGIIRTFLYAPG